MDWSRPTPEGEREVAAVHQRLRAVGVPEGPRGYDLAALELAAALLDWVSDTGPANLGDPAPCVAVVGLRRELAGTAYIGWGWNEAVALARAVDWALAHHPRASAPRPP
ncbi:MAG: hypothetical protein M3Q71_18690 [Chloroflexota bacterium]|nr:hypothetical protein [Chloroflexota bacterium]MDP9472663.1 hypothetical protein [Chloroflexota bacterium]